MEKTVQELKFMIRDLILEVGELKERISMLEGTSNQTVAKPVRGFLEIAGENYENLGRLYMDGYHVCHEVYGCLRDGECLFCLSLIERV
ncbi:MAG: initiation control protein YabA [Syntrophomonadaceae bacterium]|jgi:regulator of replication initiation timing